MRVVIQESEKLCDFENVLLEIYKKKTCWIVLLDDPIYLEFMLIILTFIKRNLNF
jgi:hypothetical protein